MQKINVHLLEDLSGKQSKLLLPDNKPQRIAVSVKNHLSPALIHVLEEVQRELGFENAADPEENKSLSSVELESLIQRVTERLGLSLTAYERDQVLAYVEKGQKPFGLLQDLVDDPQVSDIIVSGYSQITVQQGRRNFTTDLSFPNQGAYQAFVERLLKRAGTSFSTKHPICDGMIGSFARVHAVHQALCDQGPYLTVRLNRFSEVSIEDLIKAGLAPEGIFNYLQCLVAGGQTLLVVGEVGTGKTTLTRALASTISPEESILVIEDTPEIKLEHPQVRYIRTREANSDDAGKISPSECIRAGMRMAMNRIIFGEMRGAEAAEAFIDVCASGHPGLSTIHARSAAEAVTRLELFLGRAQKGVAASVLGKQISTAVQVIVYLDLCRITGRRRIFEVKEIGPVADSVLRQKDIFRYQVTAGMPSWKLVNRVSSYRETLERGGHGVVLSSFPPVLELDPKISYKEAASQAARLQEMAA